MKSLSPKAQRGIGLAAIAAVLGLAATLTLTALEDSVVYFYGPSELITKHELKEKSLDGQRIRIGGLVEAGSLNRQDSLVQFQVSDGETAVMVAYDGILPDLFREGQGIIAEGTFDGRRFTADTILAKHDESYMPKEVANLLKENGVWQGDQEGDYKGDQQDGQQAK